MEAPFQPLPEAESLELAWPTRRRDLFERPESYVARTPANPAYGMPGWTRDAGRRLHRGVDIAPVRVRPSDRRVTLNFTNLETGVEYPSEQPAWIPEDDVFSVLAGEVSEAVVREDDSDFGLHVVIRHRWPGTGRPLFTLYGHLALVLVGVGQEVAAGHKLGELGATSRSADARAWMAAFPHLHFEARDEEQRRYDPLEFLRRYLAR